MRTENHKHKILEYMRQHGSITPMEALREFGCYRLGARIYDLRRSGVRIKTELVEGMTRPGFFRRLKGENPNRFNTRNTPCKHNDSPERRAIGQVATGDARISGRQ